jgi:hypothetical protein
MVFENQPVELEYDQDMEKPGNRLGQHPKLLIKAGIRPQKKWPGGIGNAKSKIPEKDWIAPPKSGMEELKTKESSAEQRYDLKNNS